MCDSSHYHYVCEYCDDIWDECNLVDCNGCMLCVKCAYNDGWDECPICGTWDYSDIICSNCCKDYYGW